jgi:hypothetical protein
MPGPEIHPSPSADAAIYDKIKGQAVAAELRGDFAAALREWTRARDAAPTMAEAARREIELLLQLGDYETAHVRTFTALQKFSDEQGFLELKPSVEQALLGHHDREARHALSVGDRAKATYHYEMATALQQNERYKFNELDLAREVSPYFENMLADIDGPHPCTRIYIMGSGRSGTFLLTCLMECFDDTYTLPDEVQAGMFARLRIPERVHVLKRNSLSPLLIDYLSHQIHLLFIVRFPLDVLVSSLRGTPYFLPTAMWQRHTASLRRLITARRPNLKVIRYEDLVRWPDDLQHVMARHYGLRTRRPFSEFHDGLTLSQPVATAMNGIRPLDSASIGRWCGDPQHLEHCRRIWPEIREDALWLCEAFGYDVPVALEAGMPANPSCRSPQEQAFAREVQFRPIAHLGPGGTA